MFYVYRNTLDTSEKIAKFDDEDQALSYMEHLALTALDPNVIGFAVRDYDLKITCEYEI
jgi:hypothetical protein